MNKKNKIIIFLILNLSALVIGIFCVNNGNLWRDEGFYYHGALLYSKGFIPYIDFFYHRLPLHIELYGSLFKIFGDTFLIGRYISLFFYLLLINLISLLTFFLIRNYYASLLCFVAMLNPIALYGYLKNSTYALSANLIILSALIIYIPLKTKTKWFLFILINFLIWSNRYLIDYQSFFMLGLFLSSLYIFKNDLKTSVVIIGSFILGTVILFKYTIIFGDKNILFDTIDFNFLQKKYIIESGYQVSTSIKDTIKLFANLRLLEFDAYYPYIVFCLFSIVFIFVRFFNLIKNRRWDQFKNDPKEIVKCYLALIFLMNFSFYYLSVNDWPVGKLYVYPLMILLSLIIIFDLLNHLAKVGFFFHYKVLLSILFCLFIFQGFSSSLEFIKTSYLKSDMYLLKKVNKLVNESTKSREGMMLTFSPSLATSHFINEPLLNMDLYTFKPNFDENFIRKYKLMSPNILLNKIKEQKYDIIILSNERFYKKTGLPQILNPYRQDILDIIDNRYEKIKNLDINLMGGLSIYLPLSVNK